MADINTIALTPIDLGIISNQLPITGKMYNTNIRNLDRFIDFTDAITANIVGATTTEITSGQPLTPSRKTTFRTGLVTNRPVSASSAPVKRTVVTATGGGVEFDFTSNPITIDPNGVIGLPLKVSSLTPTITVVLEGATSADTLTFTAINTGNSGFIVDLWSNLALKVSSATVAGTIDYNSIRKVKITASAAMTFFTQQTQVGNNILSVIGAEVPIAFHCIQELAMEADRAVEMIKCGNNTIDSRATAYEATFTITIKDFSIAHEAYMNGKTLKRDSTQYITKTLNGTGGARNLPVTAGVITSGLTVVPANVYVEMDGVPLARVSNPNNIDRGTYHVTAAGVFTFSVDWNGFFPTIRERKQSDSTYYKVNGVADSFEMELYAPRKTADGVTLQYTLHRAKFNNYTPSQEDPNVQTEVEIALLPVYEGDEPVYTTISLS